MIIIRNQIIIPSLRTKERRHLHKGDDAGLKQPSFLFGYFSNSIACFMCRTSFNESLAYHKWLPQQKGKFFTTISDELHKILTTWIERRCRKCHLYCLYPQRRWLAVSLLFGHPCIFLQYQLPLHCSPPGKEHDMMINLQICILMIRIVLYWF